MSDDKNILLIKKAIETKTRIILVPRRSHTIKGIPLDFNESTLRIYVNTGGNVETILLAEVGHASFPVELWQIIQPQPKEKPQVKKTELSLDLAEFITSCHYENLTTEQLIEKIKELKNKELKENWLKQIKDDSK